MFGGAAAVADSDRFAFPKGQNGCFLLKEIGTGKTILEFGDACRERVSPCSTFKVPLALMALDSGVITEETPFAWDGRKRLVEDWNRDQTPRSWLRDSVVWVSQKITPQLGRKKIDDYLARFDYGNQDFSGGLTKAWLDSSLKISPAEQVDFLMKLRKHELKVSDAAAAHLFNILPAAPAEKGVEILGKTGSGFSWSDLKHPYRLGWYVGYLFKGGKEYAFAANFREKTTPGKMIFSGPEARQFALDALKSVALKP
jgi:beta-lactamase class D/beta-lactamase class D OXA-1